MLLFAQALFIATTVCADRASSRKDVYVSANIPLGASAVHQSSNRPISAGTNVVVKSMPSLRRDIYYSRKLRSLQDQKTLIHHYSDNPANSINDEEAKYLQGTIVDDIKQLGRDTINKLKNAADNFSQSDVAKVANENDTVKKAKDVSAQSYAEISKLKEQLESGDLQEKVKSMGKSHLKTLKSQVDQLVKQLNEQKVKAKTLFDEKHNDASREASALLDKTSADAIEQQTELETIMSTENSTTPTVVAGAASIGGGLAAIFAFGFFAKRRIEQSTADSLPEEVEVDPVVDLRNF